MKTMFSKTLLCLRAFHNGNSVDVHEVFVVIPFHQHHFSIHHPFGQQTHLQHYEKLRLPQRKENLSYL